MKLDTTHLLSRVGGSRVTVDIRPLQSQADLRRCIAMQRRTWGEDFAEVAPASILKIAQRLGGIVAGAFDGRGILQGFVFGITGIEHGTVVHWSHMLAVVPEAQNRGIGRQLKEYQRHAVARIGAKTIYWTFDPLVARNAHLNLNVLGVRVTDYVEDMYGESASPLHRGIGTDRLTVAWPVDDAAIASRRSAMAAARHHADHFRIAVPLDIAALQESDVAAARTWREQTRAAFQQAFARGLDVCGFEIDDATGTGSYICAPRL